MGEARTSGEGLRGDLERVTRAEPWTEFRREFERRNGERRLEVDCLDGDLRRLDGDLRRGARRDGDRESFRGIAGLLAVRRPGLKKEARQ